jgi:hypothetical protein
MTDNNVTPEPQAPNPSESTPSSVVTQETAVVVVPVTVTKPLNIPPPADIGGLEKKGL